MWSKPTIEMAMDRMQHLEWPEREAASDMARSADELISLVDRYIRGAKVTEEMQRYRRGYIETWFGPADGTRCMKAAEAIDAMLARRGGRRSVFTPLRGLEVTPRQVATAVLRYALGRKPNQSLRQRLAVNVLDPKDKQVTRNDVRAYARLVAPAIG